MLNSIEIENLAVIEHGLIDFDKGLNIFTGETGAGKSVVLRGIQAILGQKVTRDIVRSGTQKAVITAVFTEISEAVRQKAAELDLEIEDDELIIRREIGENGKSSAKINYHTVTASALREIGSLLINIHGQHDNQTLLDPSAHLKVIDDFGECEELAEDYRQSFRELQSSARKLKDFITADEENKRRQLLYKEQFDEISALKIKDEGEEERLERRLRTAQSAEELMNVYRSGAAVLTENEGSVTEKLSEISDMLRDYSEFNENFSSLARRLDSARIEIKDVAEELSSGTDDAWVDEEELENIQARLDKFYRLKKKYICDFPELITLRDEAEQKLSEIETGSEMIKKLKAERQALLVEVSEKAKKLSARREEAGKLFSERVSAELEFLNMPNVSVIVDVKKGKLTADGMDNIEILISANPGEEPKSISKIASGGELSRIMLAIKSVIADRDSIPTLIFDEIDSGVSGKAAQKIGFKLRELRSAHQIICVTHLSQLAVMADRHFLIEKSTDGNSTRTTINPLSTDERIMEIARIMGGADPGEAIIKGAKEELEKAQAI